LETASATAATATVVSPTNSPTSSTSVDSIINNNQSCVGLKYNKTDLDVFMKQINYMVESVNLKRSNDEKIQDEFRTFLSNMLDDFTIKLNKIIMYEKYTKIINGMYDLIF
jgi:hypothetical protein